MNYIKELNAFHQFLLVNQLPFGAISLWNTLMSFNNMVRWKKRFNASDAIVGQLSGLSRQGIVNARDKLIEHGLIICEDDHKKGAPIYEMISLEYVMDTTPDLVTDPSLDTPNRNTPDASHAQLLFDTPMNTDMKPDASLDALLDTSLDLSADKHLTILKHKQNKKRRQDRTAHARLLTIKKQRRAKHN